MAMEEKSSSEELLVKLNGMAENMIAYEQDLWKFFALSDNLFCVAEKDGRFLRVNPAWTRCLGWDEQEITTRNWLDFVHPEDVVRTQAAAEQMERVEIKGFENRYRHKDGSYRHLRWTAQTWGEDRITYAVAQDVTNRRKAEEMLKELGQARQALNVKTDTIINLLRA